MITIRPRPRTIPTAQDEYIFNTPNIVKVTPHEFILMEIRLALGEKHNNGVVRFIPLDDIRWQAAQILDRDDDKKHGVYYGIPIAPLIEHMKEIGLKHRPQLKPNKIPEHLAQEAMSIDDNARYDNWVLVARDTTENDAKWQMITMASTREWLEEVLPKAKDSLGDKDDVLEFLIIERLPNIQKDPDVDLSDVL